MKNSGYHTIHCGKAHWGAIDTPGGNPHHFGFEVNIAGHAGGGLSSYLGEQNFGNRTDQWYFFYHDGAYSLNGEPGDDCRRQVCVEYMHFNKDGSIKPINLTVEGISVKQKK